jgi:hypothetical protein
MLRRYIVANAWSTVALYAVVFAAAPHVFSAVETLRLGFSTFVLESQTLAPLVYRLIAPWA